MLIQTDGDYTEGAILVLINIKLLCLFYARVCGHKRLQSMSLGVNQGNTEKNNVISVHIVLYAKCSSFGKTRKANAELILQYILGAGEEGMGENLYSEDTVTYGEHSRHFDLPMAGIDQSVCECLTGRTFSDSCHCSDCFRDSTGFLWKGH